MYGNAEFSKFLGNNSRMLDAHADFLLIILHLICALYHVHLNTLASVKNMPKSRGRSRLLHKFQANSRHIAQLPGFGELLQIRGSDYCRITWR